MGDSVLIVLHLTLAPRARKDRPASTVRTRHTTYMDAKTVRTDLTELGQCAQRRFQSADRKPPSSVVDSSPFSATLTLTLKWLWRANEI
jgi:hypothetical protein